MSRISEGCTALHKYLKDDMGGMGGMDDRDNRDDIHYQGSDN